jgi:hypothetical protein
LGMANDPDYGLRGDTTPAQWYRRGTNFHEKALFVKADLAASVWPSLTGPALRAMLPSALSVSQLSSDSVHYGIRLFGLPRRRCNLRNGLSYS